MDQDTIENHIKNLGKRDFDALIAMILAEFYGFTAIDVDGKGDGGSDYLLFGFIRRMNRCFHYWRSLELLRRSVRKCLVNL